MNVHMKYFDRAVAAILAADDLLITAIAGMDVESNPGKPDDDDSSAASRPTWFVQSTVFPSFSPPPTFPLLRAFPCIHVRRRD